MKGLYFYKLLSPYNEDVTKDCKLTINEIDHNFVTLKNEDIKDVKFDEEYGLLVLTKNNGEELVAKLDLSHFTKDFNVEWNDEKSSLVFNFDDKVVEIEDLASKVTNVTNIVQEIISQTITDNTIKGVGLGKDPLGINPLEIPGTYKAVEKLINKFNGEELPSEDTLKKGDRFLSFEKINKYGYLYDFESVNKINSNLKNGWRIPTKDDWDNMLNAIELCDEYRNHAGDVCNVYYGKYAGKLLKYGEFWKEYDSSKESQNNEPKLNPEATKGVDSYGFSIYPAGHGDGNLMLGYVGEESEFWTSTVKDSSDVYTKRFIYNKNGVLQIAESPQAVCSLRLVKDYDGNNFVGVETINGENYQTVLMPSENAKHGFSIWMASNVAFENEEYKPIKINHDEILIRETAYYINEWDGFKWIKKQMIDGDSLIIKNGPDDEKNHEYQLINGGLINVKHDLRKELESVVESLTVKPIEEEGKYIASVEQNNGVVNASTKTLVNEYDRILTFGDSGVYSNLNLIEDDSEKEEGVKRVYKLVDKNQEMIGNPIVIDDSTTNYTYISNDIPVAGGPLASLVEGTTKTIKAGTNIQDLLFTLFCQEKYPENPRFNLGSISASIPTPTFTIYKASTSNVISNNTEVESGTLIDINALTSPKASYVVNDSTWTGFDFGYSVDNNKKEGDGNPKKLNNTTPSQITEYFLSRSFTGFDNKVATQTADGNNDNTKVTVSKLSNVTVAEGTNTISSYVTGATFSTTFSADILAYYACSNLGNTKDEKYVTGDTHTKTTNLPTNSYNITIKGGRYSFIGTFENNDFTPTSESVRNMAKIAFNKENTEKVTASAGKTCVVIAYPESWGKIKQIKDANSMNAPIQDNFVMHQIDVHGANGYKAIPYYVYVLKSDVTLGAIDYEIEF